MLCFGDPRGLLGHCTCTESTPSPRAPQGLCFVLNGKCAQGFLLVLCSSHMQDEDALCTGSSVPLWAVLKSSQKAFSRRNVRGMWPEYMWPDSTHGTLRTCPLTQDHHPDPQAQNVQLRGHISLPPWPIPAATEGDQLRNRVQTWQCRAGDLPFGPHSQRCIRCRVNAPAPPPPHLVFRWSWYCFTSPLRG